MALPNSLPTSPAEVTGTMGEQVEAEETWLALAGSANESPLRSPLSQPSVCRPLFQGPPFLSQHRLHLPSGSKLGPHFRNSS